MKWTDPKLWIGTLSTLVVAWVAIDSMGRTSPGPLSSVHGIVAGLEGRRTCAQCHGGFFRDMTQACLSCHAPISAQIDGSKGLHGSLARDRARACATCHSEHHGAGFAIVNRTSFALVGVPDPEHFDHTIVGYRMDGKHLELECTKCHANSKRAVLEKDTSRFSGLTSDCSSCHEDVHRGRMQVACAACHGQDDFNVLVARDHDKVLSLAGGHAGVECRTCHESGSTYALEAMGGRQAPERRDCEACHPSPHGSGFSTTLAQLERKSPSQTCAECHRPEHRKFGLESTLTPRQHAAIGFPLGRPHDKVQCGECHGPVDAPYATRHEPKKPDDCRACHGDPHDGQFDKGPFAAAGCLGCHERIQFTPHAVTPDLHARSGFALDGGHLKAKCEDCHTRASETVPRAFAGTPTRCDACHADAHDGFFASPVGSTDCARCHATSHFAETVAAGFDHARDARFPIRGAHAQADCTGCHPPAVEPDAKGRSFGRVAATTATFTDCTPCHRDPHDGRFDIRGQTGCARCHVETSFRALDRGFDHRRWTGFALTGAHQTTDCTSCHAQRFEPDAAGRTWEQARGTSCADCHADVHDGQFRVDNRTDCARCHAAGANFHELVFDHDRDSRFALGDQHRKVACAACHLHTESNGRGVVRYKPIATDCATCHGTIRDPLRRQGRGK